MGSVWESLRESLYFFRRHFGALARLLLPVALPAFTGAELRAWGVLHGDDKLISQDGGLLVLEALLGLYALAVTLAYAVAEVDGRSLAPLALARRALLAIPSLLALQLLMVLGILALSVLPLPAAARILLLLPAVLWLMATLLPAFVYVVAEGQSVPEALRSSHARFRPVVWQFMTALLLMMLVLLVPMIPAVGALNALIASLPSLPLRVLCSTAMDSAALLLTQLWPVLLVRYYDMLRQPAE